MSSKKGVPTLRPGNSVLTSATLSRTGIGVHLVKGGGGGGGGVRGGVLEEGGVRGGWC